ncbi:MAG: sialidase family protein [Mangrovibacterium sp.]
MKNPLDKIVIVALLCTTLVRFAAAQDDQSFFNSPMLIDNPASVDGYKPESRKFTGISSLAVSPKGRIWASWYTGKTPGENANNYVVVSTSGDGGNTWKEVMVIDPDGDGPARAFDPELWVDPKGKLWVFWAQSVGHIGTIAGVWTMTTKDADLENVEWSTPKRLTNGIMMCKPLVLSTGEWVLPASTWRMTDNSAKMIVSKNKGKSWEERGAVHVPKEVREFDEHMIIEKKDGSLWMLVRTKYGIGESTSTDKGVSWSPLVPSKFKHPSARFFIRRLNSGNLLLVKHGPIDVKTGRSHLMAFISKDDGESWSKGFLLDERVGVSYPDGQQLDDGRIILTYDYNRTKEQYIMMTSFTEDDILNSDYDTKIVEVFNQRKIISDGGEIDNK